MIKINVITNNNKWLNYIKKPNFYLDKKISKLNSKETKFKKALLNFNLSLLKYSRPFLPPFFRLIAPARWAKQRLTRNPNLSFKDKSKL